RAALGPAEACTWDTAANHGKYVSCASHWAFRSVHDGSLSRGCRKSMRRAAVQSVCGKPDFVTCCRQNDDGSSRCVVKTESTCVNVGGTVGLTHSCLDACPSPGSPSGAFLTDSLF